MATLKELSERTGYAPATISRILTGDPSLAVSPEARKKVLEEAGRLNYAATKSRRGRAPKTLMRAADKKAMMGRLKGEEAGWGRRSNYAD